MKTLFILAGANGSGKSTIAKELLPEENIVYVNAKVQQFFLTSE